MVGKRGYHRHYAAASGPRLPLMDAEFGVVAANIDEAALKQGLNDGRIRRDERAVLFNCATGLKYPLPPIHRTLDRHKPIDFAAL